MQTITISKEFKRSTTKAILSIAFFVLVYLLLIIAAIALTIVCGYAGIMLIAVKPMILTIMVGIGLIGMGVLLIFFLIKFIFSKNETDNSHLIEITREQQPQLFTFIDDIVKEVNTDFPKKVYISSQVNASVFYDSGFWSMFFPVKKNLHIGLGLMNAVTVNEFKGILAHEFGHFSQRSMKVGSYVYNVNYVLHNMLHDNTGYSNIISRWASISGYFSIFVAGGIKLIGGIQWVLGNVYKVVNINYMALSREMEFHADEVAANVAGPEALATSLVRLDLANHALNTVLDFYAGKIEHNIKPDDIFAQHHFVMSHSGHEYGLHFEHGLPQVTLATKNRFNKSKLAFDDQWASHPSDNDRIKRLELLNIKVENTDNRPALDLFVNVEKIRTEVTGNLFSGIEYTAATTVHAAHDFNTEFELARAKNLLPKKYNNFYDDLPLAPVNLDKLSLTDRTFSEKELFSQNSVNLVYEIKGIEYDLSVIRRIESGEVTLTSFDYEGIRYNRHSTYQLIPSLQAILLDKKLELDEHSRKIYAYYLNSSQAKGLINEYKEKYRMYQHNHKNLENNIALLTEMYNLTEFTNQSTPYEVIEANIEKVYNKEKELKEAIKSLTEDATFISLNDTKANEAFKVYLELDKPYFSNPVYNDPALRILFSALHYYNVTIHNIDFKFKKDFLDFQATLNNN
ncbi:M48 family metalloprotease [Flavobacterium sp. Sd200]|uniref:M48 family metalloprotease n=1 Tax=Flavobacterium sp. Sd200 TaxID=2692211 RepID=UPI00136D1FF8|nr:M48 family metallopeptidase [Flavobacterium sp. Sd200]MXN90428.1 M48 family metalloprotease [Flavobacterium sp. Sd200]